ncbi:hypothetical protein Peur_044394 [Populus x canadensis]
MATQDFLGRSVSCFYGQDLSHGLHPRSFDHLPPCMDHVLSCRESLQLGVWLLGFLIISLF